ncbi:MAG: RteC domain-containing protein [Bacteroidetes bacterium]|nr:RteC domain-containing protein [Bacteroidota bacterium]MCB9447659.1 RteC domain-containing protein [Flavobacteriales bacterium]
MKKVINTLIDDLEKELKLIESEESNILKKSEHSIYKIQECLKSLEKFAISNRFKNTQEEICFFKELKPRIFSKLIYYVRIYNIESKRPNGSDRVQKKYLMNELDRLKSFFDNNLEFYQYYRTGATYLDDKYFVRGKHDIRLSLDTFFFATNSKFSTSHDYKVSKILANELLRIYLNAELTALERKEEHPLCVLKQIRTKGDLI